MASSLKSLEELQACMEGAVAAAQTSRGAARAASTAVAAAAAAAEDLAVKSWAAEEAATEALAAVVAEKNVAVPSSYASGTTADMSASRRQHRRDTAAVAVGGAREAVQAAVDLGEALYLAKVAAAAAACAVTEADELAQAAWPHGRWHAHQVPSMQSRHSAEVPMPSSTPQQVSEVVHQTIRETPELSMIMAFLTQHMAEQVLSMQSEQSAGVQMPSSAAEAEAPITPQQVSEVIRQTLSEIPELGMMMAFLTQQTAQVFHEDMDGEELDMQEFGIL